VPEEQNRLLRLVRPPASRHLLCLPLQNDEHVCLLLSPVYSVCCSIPLRRFSCWDVAEPASFHLLRSPDVAKVRSKMIYAASKDSFRKELEGEAQPL
jgi:hypothetical protein